MNRTAILALLPLFASVGIAQAETAPATSITEVVYSCERGVEIPVAYIVPEQGEGFAVVQIDGRQVAMKEDVSGSGAMYRSTDEAMPYALDTKEDQAMITFGPESDSKDLFMDCKEKK